MSDFGTMTTDELLDRLADLERELDVDPQPGSSMSDAVQRLYRRMKEATLINIELAKRTATGWRPL